MRPTPWTDTHDRLVSDAAPPVPEASAAELERAWGRIARAMEDGDAPRRRRRLRTGVAVGIAVALLGTSGLAVAERYSAHTGRGPADAEDLRLGGPGEKLALAAPDYGQVVAEETRDIPFPDAASRAFAIRDQVRDVKGALNDEFVSTGAVRAWVADQAICSWSNQWAAATRSGNDADRTEAIAMIQAAPRWPAVVAIDPAPYSRMELYSQDDAGDPDAERYRDTSQFFYLAALGEAVEGSDPGAVAAVLAANNGYCRPGNVPDLPQADPMYRDR